MKSFIAVAETYHYALPFFEHCPDRARFFSYGLGFPDMTEFEGTAWWMAGGFAARLYVAGIAPKLSAPGATWLSTVPIELLQRKITTTLAEDFPLSIVWAKPSETKIPQMKPGYWTREQVMSMGNPAQTRYEWSDTFHEDLNHEHRVFMVHGEPVTASAYLVDGRVFPHGTTSKHTDSAISFAREVAQEMGGGFPPVCSLDVGLTAQGWMVIEANPAWSSGPYGCDMNTLIDALDVACNETDSQWMWSPSAYAQANAEKTPAFIADEQTFSGLMRFGE